MGSYAIQMQWLIKRLFTFFSLGLVGWLSVHLWAVSKASMDRPILNKAYIYKGYLVERNNITYLRILSINPCTSWPLTATINGYSLYLTPTPMESHCPWQWADGCFLNPYFFESMVPQRFAHLDNWLVLSSHGKSIALEADYSPLPLSDELTVCVPPIYWYTDWRKLMVFIEWWKTQGASNFNVYFHSGTSSVVEVLGYYERQGYLTKIDWSLLPKLHDAFDPNDSVYRLAHSMAHNDCVMRAWTKYAALVDIDEMLYIHNETVLDYARHALHDNSNIGSVSFQHQVLRYNDIIDDSFEFINAAEVHDITGPPKVLFRVDRVKSISSHFVNSFWNSSHIQQKINASTGILLHNRYNYQILPGTVGKPIKILSNIDADKFIGNLNIQKRPVFASVSPEFNPHIQETLGRCLGRWRQTMGNCKAPVSGCRHLLEPLADDWVQMGQGSFRILPVP